MDGHGLGHLPLQGLLEGPDHREVEGIRLALPLRVLLPQMLGECVALISGPDLGGVLTEAGVAAVAFNL